MRYTLRICAVVLTAALAAWPAHAQQDVISTVIGGGPSDMPALDANLYGPVTVAFDSQGNYYVASFYQNRIFKVSTTGLLTVLAGNGLPGYSGDGVTGGAANATLNHPNGVAVDSSGNVYIADYYNFVIRKVDTTNTITTIVGTQGACGGATGNLCYPAGVATDSSGNLYIADQSDCQVKKVVLSSNAVSVLAGSGTCGYSGDGGTATAAELNQPAAVAADASGDVYIADLYNYVIRQVKSGKIKTVAGSDAYGYTGDGGAATSATLSYVYGVTTNSTGTTVTIADTNNQAIRQFTVGGNIKTVAGGTYGFCGDGGLATAACLSYPNGVTLGPSSTLYIGDFSNQRVRAFTVGGDINTVAGNGSTSAATVVNGVAPTGVELYYPWGVYEDPSGNIYVADSFNYIVRELVASSEVVNTFAGTPDVYGYSGDSGPATSAELTYPDQVARDSSGNIYIADQSNCVVRIVNTAGTISTFAGSAQRCGFAGDGGPATSAELYYPYGVYVDSKNNVYISDTYNHVIREVTSGTINTIAGIANVAGYTGDGGPATSAELRYPGAVTVDGAGNIDIADSYNCRVRQISASTGNISTVAGNGTCGFTGDGIATENSINYPEDIWADVNGNIFIADQSNSLLRWVNSGGIMTTFAGNGSSGFSGDGGAAISSELYYPTGIWEDSSGNFLVADEYNNRIRGITAFAALSTSASSLSFPLENVNSTTPPQRVILSGVGPLTVSNISITGDFSESDDCPTGLPNGSTCVMYVYFAPKAAGTRNGTVTVNTNGYFNTVSTISLSGTGTAISLAGAPFSFGNQLVKTTSAVKTVTVKNNGTTAITMGAITFNETTDFTITANTCPASGSTLAAKGSCTISVSFTPQTTGAKKGTIVINDNDPTTPQIVGVTGTGTSNVSLSPASIAFATTGVGTASAASKVTLTNSTGVSITLGATALSTAGPFATTTASTCTNSLVIAANGTCVIDVVFKPSAVGFASGTLSVSDSDATSPQTVALTGTGTSIKFTPQSINFGTVSRGDQVSSTVTMTNGGGTTVTLTGFELSGANSADFSYSQGCGSSIGAGQTCTITVYFDPTNTGAEKATLKLYDNAPGSPQTLSLSGSGQ